MPALCAYSTMAETLTCQARCLLFVQANFAPDASFMHLKNDVCCYSYLDAPVAMLQAGAQTLLSWNHAVAQKSLAVLRACVLPLLYQHGGEAMHSMRSASSILHCTIVSHHINMVAPFSTVNAAPTLRHNTPCCCHIITMVYG